MNADFTYVIERFDVSGDKEALIEHAELIRMKGTLMCSVGGEDRVLDARDVSSAIAAEPVLNEIRANQITRITAEGPGYDELPFVLRVPGDPDDFDEARWSKTLAGEHTSENWVVQPGRFRVAYVNDFRWCPFPTPHGPRMLPEAWPTAYLSPTWGHLTFVENGGMVSGQDELFIGLATERVVAACYYPDCTVDASEHEVTLWRRGSDAAHDAQIFVDWLLDWIPATWFREEEMFVQLFVEAAVNGYNGSPVSGSRLSAGLPTAPFMGGNDTSEWNLELDLPSPAVSIALDLIAVRSPLLAEIVTAARDPHSPEAQKRRAALQIDDAEDEEEQGEWDDDADEDGDEAGDDPDAPWSHSAVERLPKVITPGEIVIQLWRHIGEATPVAFDLVFTWGGKRVVDWHYGISPDNPIVPTHPHPQFQGTANWANGVDVELTYSSLVTQLSGEAMLNGAAPTVMDPKSDESMSRPILWVDLAIKIASFLGGLPRPMGQVPSAPPPTHEPPLGMAARYAEGRPGPRRTPTTEPSPPGNGRV